jgi:hypothetical protein
MKKIKYLLAIMTLILSTTIYSQNQWLNLTPDIQNIGGGCDLSIDLFVEFENTFLGSNSPQGDYPTWADFDVNIYDCNGFIIYTESFLSSTPRRNTSTRAWGYQLPLSLSVADRIKILQENKNIRIVVELTNYDLAQDDPTWDWSLGAVAGGVNLTATTFFTLNSDPLSVPPGQRYSRAEHVLWGPALASNNLGAVQQGILNLNVAAYRKPSSCDYDISYNFDLLSIVTTPGATLNFNMRFYVVGSNSLVFTKSETVSLSTSSPSVTGSFVSTGLLTGVPYRVEITDLEFKLGPNPLPEAFCYFYAISSSCNTHEAGPTTVYYKAIYQPVILNCNPSMAVPPIPEIVNNAGLAPMDLMNQLSLSYFVKLNGTTVLDPTITASTTTPPVKVALCVNTIVPVNLQLFFPKIQILPPAFTTFYRVELYDESNPSVLVSSEYIGTAPRNAAISFTRNIYGMFNGMLSLAASRNKTYTMKLIGYYPHCPQMCAITVGQFRLALRYQETLGSTTDLLYSFSELSSNGNNGGTVYPYSTQFPTYFNEETGLYKLMLYSPKVSGTGGHNEFGQISGTITHPTNNLVNFSFTKYIGNNDVVELNTLSNGSGPNMIQHFITNNLAFKNQDVKLNIIYSSTCPASPAASYTGDYKINWRDYARGNFIRPDIDFALSTAPFGLSNKKVGTTSIPYAPGQNGFNNNMPLTSTSFSANANVLGNLTGTFKIANVFALGNNGQDLNSLGIQIFEQKYSNFSTPVGTEQCIYNCGGNIIFTELLNFQNQYVGSPSTIGPGLNVLSNTEQTIHFPINNPNEKFKVGLTTSTYSVNSYPGFTDYFSYGNNPGNYAGNCLFQSPLPCNYFSTLGPSSQYNRYRFRVHKNPVVSVKHNYNWPSGITFKDYYFSMNDGSFYNKSVQAGTSGHLNAVWSDGKLLYYKFTLDRSARFGLSIYDILGKEVMSKSEIELPEGLIEDKLDLKHLHPGIYFVRSSLDGQTTHLTIKID